MPSPWVDLLCLHGHITDLRLLRKLATTPPPRPAAAPPPCKERPSIARRAVSSLRLCLGIGDGLLRSQ